MLGTNRTGNDCQQGSEQIRRQKEYHNSSGGGILHLPPFFILRRTYIGLLFCFFDIFKLFFAFCLRILLIIVIFTQINKKNSSLWKI
jgi:hypothetical protein